MARRRHSKINRPEPYLPSLRAWKRLAEIFSGLSDATFFTFLGERTAHALFLIPPFLDLKETTCQPVADCGFAIELTDALL